MPCGRRLLIFRKKWGLLCKSIISANMSLHGMKYRDFFEHKNIISSEAHHLPQPEQSTHKTGHMSVEEVCRCLATFYVFFSGRGESFKWRLFMQRPIFDIVWESIMFPSIYCRYGNWFMDDTTITHLQRINPLAFVVTKNVYWKL